MTHAEEQITIFVDNIHDDLCGLCVKHWFPNNLTAKSAFRRDLIELVRFGCDNQLPDDKIEEIADTLVAHIITIRPDMLRVVATGRFD